MQRNAHMGDRRVTPTRRVTAGDGVTTVVTSHVSHGCACGHGMRPGHRGCPALSILLTAWRAPFGGAPVTAEGWGPITPPKGAKATRHHTLADRTHEQWTTDPSSAVDPPALPGIPPGKTLRTRDGEIGIPPIGSD